MTVHRAAPAGGPGGSQAYLWALVAGLMVSGTLSTVATKHQDTTVVDASTGATFNHPAFQSACMFLGEAMCLLTFFARFYGPRLLAAARGSGGGGGGGAGGKPRGEGDTEDPLRARLLVDDDDAPPPPAAPVPAPEPPLVHGPLGAWLPSASAVRVGLRFGLPALCDATGSTLLNIGLFYTQASTYQMLRGSQVLFAGLLTALILRRRLLPHHWLGMALVTGGAALCGYASLLVAAAAARHAPAAGPPPPAAGPGGGLGWGGGGARGLLFDSQALLAGAGDARRGAGGGPGPGGSGFGPPGAPGAGHGRLAAAFSTVLLGDALVVIAQLCSATQFVVEEKFLAGVPAELAVGIEGCWGLLICALALPLLSAGGGPGGSPFDSFGAAVAQTRASPPLQAAIAISILAIGVFNFCGVSLTKALSGSARATIDACRTIFVWAYSLQAGWEVFSPLQLLGFAIIVTGSGLYNEVLVLPPELALWLAGGCAWLGGRGAGGGGGGGGGLLGGGGGAGGADDADAFPPAAVVVDACDLLEEEGGEEEGEGRPTEPQALGTPPRPAGATPPPASPSRHGPSPPASPARPSPAPVERPRAAEPPRAATALAAKLARQLMSDDDEEEDVAAVGAGSEAATAGATASAAAESAPERDSEPLESAAGPSTAADAGAGPSTAAAPPPATNRPAAHHGGSKKGKGKKRR